jgi:tRNA nucleotidyltransferase (CCA-adding enzyme)
LSGFAVIRINKNRRAGKNRITGNIVAPEKHSNHGEAQPITVITTHINADFDAVGSLLAAHKLYPGSHVVFPGFHEKSAKNFFVQSMAYLFNMIDIRDMDLSTIKRLVVVDTKQAGRIGDLAVLLENPEVEVHVYDHHPALTTDMAADIEITRPTGANVTLLTEIIKEKEIDITPEEATIMCLGIYEDTGAFTFPSTTENDFYAAGFLISKGANLYTISNLISKEMDPRQVNLLNELINAAEHHNINGMDVVITSVSCDDYIHDLAFLVQKMMKIDNLNAVFALALMKNKIYLAARSNTSLVNAGAVAREMGGGGHAFAAAATIRDNTMAQAEQRLIEILYRHISVKQHAREIMSAPAICADENISCGDAKSQLSRYNINALLVTRKSQGKDRLVGYISRQVIEKALYHDLDAVPIREYMTTEIADVGPDADITEIQQKIIDNKQRVLPVIENERIMGVITRTDLLNILVQESREKSAAADPLKDPVTPRTKNIIAFMKERLSDRVLSLLRRLGETAQEMGFSAYLIGGFVRDLFLYRHNEDMDIVIEGDGIAFAREFARRSGARINAYDKFGTAVIIFPDGYKIDVASARMEYYSFPAALPTVEMSSIKLDLFRRDFTINTLAVSLNPAKFGKLIDFFGAQRDIKEKTIRVLHNLSFVEDPTRVFRAIRFEQRFGFKIGKLTAGLINNAVKMDFFKRLSGKRVFAELRHILEEENPVASLIRLNEFDLLKSIDPAIQYTRKMKMHFDSARKVLAWYDLLFATESCRKWVVYFLILIRHAGEENAEAICRRFELAPKHRKIFLRERRAAEECLARLHRNGQLKNHLLYRTLKDFDIEQILYMMALAANENVVKAISFFVTDLRHTRLHVSGRDLQALGLSPSPMFGRILSAVMDARLNGELKTRQDEYDFLKNYVDGL